LSRLRLEVAVPEAWVGAIVPGAVVHFGVPAYPGEQFSGVVSRIARSLDHKTRSMPVELDVANAKLRLAPGMYPEVAWPIHRAQPSLLVPASSVVTNTERTFVIRVNSNSAEWVDVMRGVQMGDLIEVFGALRAGDLVVKRGSDELKPHTQLAPSKPAS